MTMPPPGQWPPPPQGHPQGPPQWNPQPGPPPKGGNKAKWILGGLALLVVVVVTVVATLLVTRGNSGSTTPTASPPSTSVDASDIASANDRGPAGIITEDPTCAAWTNISNTFGQAASNGWDRRDPAVPAAEWTPDLRNQYEAVSAAMASAADRTVVLAKTTPHRVVRELYEQFIAYSRAYIESLQSYTEEDDRLVRVAVSSSSALSAICDAIAYGSAGARSPLVARAAPPSKTPAVSDPAQASRFLEMSDPVCAEWLEAVSKFDTDSAAWRSLDPNTPATELDPSQRAIYVAVMPVMSEFATRMQLLGRSSDNATLADLATLSAQYLRAYSAALPTYVPADDYLQIAAGSIGGVVSEACRSVGAR